MTPLSWNNKVNKELDKHIGSLFIWKHYVNEKRTAIILDIDPNTGLVKYLVLRKDCRHALGVVGVDDFEDLWLSGKNIMM